ncbi:hypothetical protein ACNVED_10150 [Legionella sp. D16C41]|uniref:hypothetical protein n=1 Tax=Legionella sp. D16C41 TaxID=3402688 RepID=UPI003AF905F6
MLTKVVLLSHLKQLQDLIKQINESLSKETPISTAFDDIFKKYQNETQNKDDNTEIVTDDTILDELKPVFKEILATLESLASNRKKTYIGPGEPASLKDHIQNLQIILKDIISNKKVKKGNASPITIHSSVVPVIIPDNTFTQVAQVSINTENQTALAAEFKILKQTFDKLIQKHESLGQDKEEIFSSDEAKFNWEFKVKLNLFEQKKAVIAKKIAFYKEYTASFSTKTNEFTLNIFKVINNELTNLYIDLGNLLAIDIEGAYEELKTGNSSSKELANTLCESDALNSLQKQLTEFSKQLQSLATQNNFSTFKKDVEEFIKVFCKKFTKDLGFDQTTIKSIEASLLAQLNKGKLQEDQETILYMYQFLKEGEQLKIKKRINSLHSLLNELNDFSIENYSELETLKQTAENNTKAIEKSYQDISDSFNKNFLQPEIESAQKLFRLLLSDDKELISKKTLDEITAFQAEMQLIYEEYYLNLKKLMEKKHEPNNAYYTKVTNLQTVAIEKLNLLKSKEKSLQDLHLDSIIKSFEDLYSLQKETLIQKYEGNIKKLLEDHASHLEPNNLLTSFQDMLKELSDSKEKLNLNQLQNELDEKFKILQENLISQLFMNMQFILKDDLDKLTGVLDSFTTERTSKLEESDYKSFLQLTHQSIVEKYKEYQTASLTTTDKLSLQQKLLEEFKSIEDNISIKRSGNVVENAMKNFADAKVELIEKHRVELEDIEKQLQALNTDGQLDVTELLKKPRAQLEQYHKEPQPNLTEVTQEFQKTLKSLKKDILNIKFKKIIKEAQQLSSTLSERLKEHQVNLEKFINLFPKDTENKIVQATIVNEQKLITELLKQVNSISIPKELPQFSLNKSSEMSKAELVLEAAEKSLKQLKDFEKDLLIIEATIPDAIDALKEEFNHLKADAYEKKKVTEIFAKLRAILTLNSWEDIEYKTAALGFLEQRERYFEALLKEEPYKNTEQQANLTDFNQQLELLKGDLELRLKQSKQKIKANKIEQKTMIHQTHREVIQQANQGENELISKIKDEDRSSLREKLSKNSNLQLPGIKNATLRNRLLIQESNLLVKIKVANEKLDNSIEKLNSGIPDNVDSIAFASTEEVEEQVDKVNEATNELKEAATKYKNFIEKTNTPEYQATLMVLRTIELEYVRIIRQYYPEAKFDAEYNNDLQLRLDLRVLGESYDDHFKENEIRGREAHLLDHNSIVGGKIFTRARDSIDSRLSKLASLYQDFSKINQAYLENNKGTAASDYKDALVNKVKELHTNGMKGIASENRAWFASIIRAIARLFTSDKKQVAPLLQAVNENPDTVPADNENPDAVPAVINRNNLFFKPEVRACRTEKVIADAANNLVEIIVPGPNVK